MTVQRQVAERINELSEEGAIFIGEHWGQTPLKKCCKNITETLKAC